MGLLETLPQGLIMFLTWLVIWITCSLLILIISIGVGRLLGEFLDGIIGWVK